MPKNDLFFDKPLMNAAGTLGFAPDLKAPINLSSLGAFVTNPVSQRPRKPSQGKRYHPYAGGFLLHTGLPNPGLRGVIRRYYQRWARSDIPVIVHLLAQEPTSLARMIEHLEGIDGVMGIEIGLPPDVDQATTMDFIQAAVGELPLIVRLPSEKAERFATTAIQTGASAVSLGAPRGTLPGEAGQTITGRMYGPGVLPLTLQAVANIAQMGIPVIGAGGIYQAQDVEAMLNAGALAVQLDTVFWRGGI